MDQCWEHIITLIILRRKIKFLESGLQTHDYLFFQYIYEKYETFLYFLTEYQCSFQEEPRFWISKYLSALVSSLNCFISAITFPNITKAFM